MIRNRSAENRRAMDCFSEINGVLSPAFSILRQELDSMIRVIYLLSIKDINERRRLIQSTLSGEKWIIRSVKGKTQKVTDREMVDISQQIQGWTQSVYRFGCAFVHLSEFHNHITDNPFEKLSLEERQHILSHMRHYHHGPIHDNPTMKDLSCYLPQVFDKISSNLESYLEELLKE